MNKKRTSKRYDCDCGNILVTAAISPFCLKCGASFGHDHFAAWAGDPGRRIDRHISEDEE